MPFQMTHNIANFVGRKPGIHGDGKIMEPEFRLPISGPDRHMRRLVAFIE